MGYGVLEGVWEMSAHFGCGLLLSVGGARRKAVLGVDRGVAPLLTSCADEEKTKSTKQKKERQQLFERKK